MLASVSGLVPWPVAQANAAEQVAAAVVAGPAKSGLPLPRFVSLKSNRVNLRKGPGTEYPTTWVFRRAGWPLEVIEELEGWRQVRDADGTTGWMLQSFLSGRRTALVRPWDLAAASGTQGAGSKQAQVALRDDESATSPTVALLEVGVVAGINSCNGKWCHVTVGDYRGWIEQKALWGVYAGERIR